MANFHGCACVNVDMWGELYSQCKHKQNNVLQNTVACNVAGLFL